MRPKVAAISATDLPAFASRTKVSYWRISSGSRRAVFSISEASSASASSPGSITAQGSGSTAPRSSAITFAAR